MRKLLAQYIKVGILNVSVIAIAAGRGNAVRPVAKAFIILVIIYKRYLLRQRVLSPIVEQHAYGGRAAHNVRDAPLAHHLGIRGGIELHLFRQLERFAVVKRGYVLAVKRVLVCQCNLP